MKYKEEYQNSLCHRGRLLTGGSLESFNLYIRGHSSLLHNLAIMTASFLRSLSLVLYQTISVCNFEYDADQLEIRLGSHVGLVFSLVKLVRSTAEGSKHFADPVFYVERELCFAYLKVNNVFSLPQILFPRGLPLQPLLGNHVMESEIDHPLVISRTQEMVKRVQSLFPGFKNSNFSTALVLR